MQSPSSHCFLCLPIANTTPFSICYTSGIYKIREAELQTNSLVIGVKVTSSDQFQELFGDLQLTPYSLATADDYMPSGDRSPLLTYLY